MTMGKDEKLANGYVTVQEVLEQSYVVPTYQRGYRWSRNEVRKLLDDIYEDKLISGRDGKSLRRAIDKKSDEIFNIDEDSDEIQDAKNPYCIQPLVVCKEEGKESYTIIDGQQRLTTIAIIIRAIKQICTKNNIKCSEDVLDVEIEYDSRPDSGTFLNDLNIEIEDEKKKSNLDYWYMYEAFEEAYAFFGERVKDNSDDRGLYQYMDYLYDILLKNTRFIWYCINTDNMDAHEVFADFNTGKLGLTNSELIKALFMDKANYDSGNIDDKRIVISEKWDEIENALHKPDFWAFVPHRDQYGDGGYDTRIDVIFELFLLSEYVNSKKDEKQDETLVEDYIKHRKGASRDRYLFEEIEKWLKEKLQASNEKNTKNKIMDECWYEIRKVYLGLQELFETDTIGDNSNKIYNMAGLYINLMNRKDNHVDSYSDDPFLYFKVYYNLSKVMKKTRTGKDNRIEGFKELIKKELGITKGKSVEDFVKNIRYSDSKEIEGNNKSADMIVKVLLVYNIALLNNSEGLGQRFNFKAFSELKWQREHIFASNIDEERNESAGLDTDEERKTALRILAKDIGEKIGDNNEEPEKYVNPYIEYVKNVYFYKKEFPPKYSDIKDGKEIEGTETQLILSDDNQVDIFRERFYDTSQNTVNSMLARAIRANQRSKELLEYYELSESIKKAEELENDEDMREAYYIILKDFEKREKKLYSIGYVDISEEITEQLRGVSEQNNCTVKIGKFEKNSVNSEVGVTSIKDQYREYIKSFFYKKDSEIIKDINEIKDWEELKLIFDICKRTISSNIDKYFEEDFSKQLADNTMGNQTLLTGGTGGESQNQVVGNKSYKLKKEDVRKFLREGKFVPLGTLMVFSDTYNDSAYTSNFWLPDSRLRYLDSLIDSLTKFLKPNDELVRN